MKGKEMKYKSINNIDPIKGVTPEQLFEYCKEYLVTTLPSSFTLTPDEVTDAISNTVLAMMTQFESGKVNSTNYAEFKNYLFISLKNNIGAMHTNKKKNIKDFFRGGYKVMDYEDFDIEQLGDYSNINERENQKEYIQQVMLFEKAFEVLTDDEKNIIQQYLNGVAISRITGKRNYLLDNIISKMKLTINPIIINEKDDKVEMFRTLFYRNKAAKQPQQDFKSQRMILIKQAILEGLERSVIAKLAEISVQTIQYHQKQLIKLGKIKSEPNKT
jgi:RNA polymerase sigma factor (sigma-70 family)